MSDVVYEKHSCGGNIIDDTPHYIPLGEDEVVKIIDQKCDKCGAVIIEKYQKMGMYKNKEIHDKLMDFYSKNLHG